MSRRIYGAVLISVGLLGAIASPAWAVTINATDTPTTVTMAPGTTGAVPWTVQNIGVGTQISWTQPSTVVFQAPGNSTFPAQTTVPVQSSGDGTTYTTEFYQLRNCVVSNAGKTLTCTGSTSASAFSTLWPAKGYFRFLPQVTVDPSAPADTTLTPGPSTFNFSDAGGTLRDTAVGTLNVKTPPVPLAVPAVDPRVAGIGAVAMLGWALIRRHRRSRSAA